MNGTDLALLLVLGGLLIAAFVLGASEAALLRVQRVRAEVAAAEGDRRSGRLLHLLDDLPRVLNTVLLVVLLVQIGAATATGMLSGRHFGNLGVTLASMALTVVLFVYAEAIPKTYAVRHPYPVARATTPILAALSWLLRPIVTGLVWFADLQAPGSGIAAGATVTEDELRRLASHAVVEGSIEEIDHALMERVFEMGDRTVEEILTPRTEVIGVRVDATISEALDIAIRSGHRRLPIYEGDLDDIRGVVRLQDLAAAIIRSPDATVVSVATRELTVPETKRVVELLAEMQGASIHFALAVDEHGGTAGIVTIEDVVGELVGRVSDEGEHVTPLIRPMGHNRWIVNAAADVEDLEAVTGVSLPEGDWHTVGGLLTGLAGRIPAAGEVFDFDDLSLLIVDAAPHRIAAVEATLADQTSPS